MKSFEESLAWQRGMDLNVEVDKALAESRNFGFKDQLFRASLSICNNIAEGYEMPTVANQLKYLWIAKGSCNEVHSMLILAQRREYFPPQVVHEMLSLQDEIARLIRTYIKNKSGKWSKLPGGLILLGMYVKLSTLWMQT
jgi:four helix bundle protein